MFVCVARLNLVFNLKNIQKQRNPQHFCCCVEKVNITDLQIPQQTTDYKILSLKIFKRLLKMEILLEKIKINK